MIIQLHIVFHLKGHPTVLSFHWLSAPHGNQQFNTLTNDKKPFALPQAASVVFIPYVYLSRRFM